MFEKFINSLIASVVGCMTAIGTVWYLSDQQDVTGSITHTGNAQGVKIHSLEVDQIRLKENLVLVDAKTGKPLIEIKQSGIYAHNEIVAEALSVEGLKTRKVQLVKGDFQDENAAVYGELGLKKEGGSYLALLSPQRVHSVNMGFNDQETGFIISQNNQEDAFAAQAVFPIPRSDNAKNHKAKVAPPNSRVLPQPQNIEKVAFNSQTKSDSFSNHRLESFAVGSSGQPLSPGYQLSPQAAPNSSTADRTALNGSSSTSSLPSQSLSDGLNSTGSASNSTPSSNSLSLPSPIAPVNSASASPAPVRSEPVSSYNSLQPAANSQGSNPYPSASGASPLAPSSSPLTPPAMPAPAMTSPAMTSPAMTPPAMTPSPSGNLPTGGSSNNVQTSSTNVSSNNNNGSAGFAVSGSATSENPSVSNSAISQSFGPSVAPINY